MVAIPVSFTVYVKPDLAKGFQVTVKLADREVAWWWVPGATSSSVAEKWALDQLASRFEQALDSL